MLNTKPKTSTESSTARNRLSRSIRWAYNHTGCLNCCALPPGDDTLRPDKNADNPTEPSTEATNSNDPDTINEVVDRHQKKPERPPSITPPPITRMFLVEPPVTSDQRQAAEETILKVYAAPYRFLLWSTMTLEEQVYSTAAKEENVCESMRLDDSYLLNKVIYLHDMQVKKCRKTLSG